MVDARRELADYIHPVFHGEDEEGVVEFLTECRRHAHHLLGEPNLNALMMRVWGRLDHEHGYGVGGKRGPGGE